MLPEGLHVPSGSSAACDDVFMVGFHSPQLDQNSRTVLCLDHDAYTTASASPIDEDLSSDAPADRTPAPAVA